MINIGIDVHKKRCVATLKRKESNDIIEQTTFYNNSTGIGQFIKHVKEEFEDDAITAVCESTGNYWIRLHDTLEDNDINTLLANPLKTKIIAQARLKDDKIDSNALADLLRADLVYESFVPDKEYRELRQLVRTRLDMVTQRTMCKNKTHAILAKYEYQCPVTKTFSDKGIQWLRNIKLSWIDRMALDSYLDTLTTIEKQIEMFTAKIASVSKDDSRIRLLMTIPGIDYLTALTVISEIVDINRFSTPWKLVGYAGLTPSKRDSGDVHKSGRITKQGSRWLRYAIVEAANITIKHDYRIGNFYSRIAERRGPQKAKVAAAKEMLVIIWHMLCNMEPYRTENRTMTEQKYKRMERHSRDTV